MRTRVEGRKVFLCIFLEPKRFKRRRKKCTIVLVLDPPYINTHQCGSKGIACIYELLTRNILIAFKKVSSGAKPASFHAPNLLASMIVFTLKSLQSPDSTVLVALLVQALERMHEYSLLTANNTLQFYETWNFSLRECASQRFLEAPSAIVCVNRNLTLVTE